VKTPVLFALTHRLRWQYQKDGSRSLALGRVWSGAGLRSVTPRTLRESVPKIVSGWRGDGLSSGTVNRRVSALRVALTAARAEGSLTFDPPPLQLLPESGRRERYPSRMEVALLLRNLRHFAPLSARLTRWLYRTGMRRGEALSLRVSSVTPSSPLTVRLVDTKAGVPRTCPIPSSVTSYIKRRIKARHPDTYLFPISPASFSSHWRTARQKSNLGEWFVPHTLRHARATELIRNGTPIPVVARILGHRDWKTTMRYTHPNLEDLTNAIERR